MYQTYIPGRGPYPALFPIPLAHPSPLRPGEGFIAGPGLISTASGHGCAPILSIPSVAALRVKTEKDTSECLDLVKKDNHVALEHHSMHPNNKQNEQQSPPLKLHSHLQQQLQHAVNNNIRPEGPAEFTKFTIDEILRKNEEAQVKDESSEDELSSDEIEVVRCTSPESGRRFLEGEDGEGSVFGSANATGETDGQNDPSVRFSWLQCTRYKPPKLPRIKKKDGVKKRKLGRNPRVPFTQHQVASLEQKFQRTHYLSSVDVAELSAALNLTETRVKIWFQNRRARERRERENNIQPGGQQRSPAQQSTTTQMSTRPDAQQIANELCAQRLGQGALHNLTPAVLGASGAGPMSMTWPPMPMPPNPALIAHISQALGAGGSAFRPVSFPT